jgi:hypothetical protein
LNLETNNILGEAIKAIIVALQQNKTLTDLKLTNQKQLLSTEIEVSTTHREFDETRGLYDSDNWRAISSPIRHF